MTCSCHCQKSRGLLRWSEGWDKVGELMKWIIKWVEFFFCMGGGGGGGWQQHQQVKCLQLLTWRKFVNTLLLFIHSKQRQLYWQWWVVSLYTLSDLITHTHTLLSLSLSLYLSHSLTMSPSLSLLLSLSHTHTLSLSHFLFHTNIIKWYY